MNTDVLIKNLHIKAQDESEEAYEDEEEFEELDDETLEDEDWESEEEKGAI